MKPFAMNRCQLIVKVIVHFVFIMGLILSVTTIYSAQIGNGIEPQIEKSHPRLLIIRDDVDRIRQSVKSYSLDDYMDMKGRISRDLHAAKMNDIIYSNDGGIVRDMAFVGLISEDKTYKDKAIEWGLFLADIQASVGNDTNQRARLLAMSFVYDWLYDDLTEKQRHIIRMGIINHIELLKGFLDKPIYTGGHSRYGNACIVAGLIALYGDYGEWQGAEYLKKERRAWDAYEKIMGKDKPTYFHFASMDEIAREGCEAIKKLMIERDRELEDDMLKPDYRVINKSNSMSYLKLNGDEKEKEKE